MLATCKHNHTLRFSHTLAAPAESCHGRGPLPGRAPPPVQLPRAGFPRSPLRPPPSCPRRPASCHLRASHWPGPEQTSAPDWRLRLSLWATETFPHWGGWRVAAPTGGGGEVFGESGGSGVGRRRAGGHGLRVFACDGSGDGAAAATLVHPARLDPGPSASQPRKGEEGGCRREGRAGLGATSVWGPAGKGVAGGRAWGVEE